ncbi:branched-chain amino acid ABC transporter ATP-binding protein/permease [Chachezhania sediminis]|uniref:branched-chain amino acid ABC transporter ATP-binding protein/permease n=1 Tax=Chachezhania sediminis TaxID=2599291 RepID=UPI00131C4A90|nr:branched-chain amino acid ABC transporter ATP-binding protein/permease [Chachezhania sediminis]
MITYLLILIVASLGMSSFSAMTGILSFGHAAFIGLAAHLSALLTIPVAAKGMLLPDLPGWLAAVHMPIWASLIVTVAVVTLIGVVLGLPIARLGGSEAAIATLGLLLIVHAVVIASADYTRGSQAIYGVPRIKSIWAYFAAAAGAIFVTRYLAAARLGLLAQSIRENEPAAMSVGIRPVRVKWAVFAFSAAVSALAGVMLGHHLTVFSPKEFHFDLTFTLLVILILGGFSSVSGTVVGAVLVTALVEGLRRLEQSGIFADLMGQSVFGLTDVGLSIAVLWVLYRHNEGLFGHRELSDVIAGWRNTPPKLPEAAAIPEETQAPRELVVEGVSKAYGGVVAVDDVSFTLKTGEIVGLIGPNGSGKTTLLGCIAGTHTASTGTVKLGGHDLTHAAPYQIAEQGIGRTFQTIRLFARKSAIDNVVAAVAAARPQLSQQAAYAQAMGFLEMLWIGDLANRQAGTLAYGQQRRLEIARAMALRPAILLLDEPAAGMNEQESDDLMSILLSLRERFGVGILIVDHDLKLMMRLCERILVLNKGQLIAHGSPAEIRTNEHVLEAYMGRKATTETNNRELST